MIGEMNRPLSNGDTRRITLGGAVFKAKAETLIAHSAQIANGWT
jgi:hypothetical protein